MKLLLAVCCATAFAAQSSVKLVDRNADDVRLFENAKRRYYDAIEGKPGALGESRDLLTRLHSKNATDPLIMAYLGSARLLEAARALAPWRKGKLAKEGLRMLDEAVDKSPEHLEIRFLRAVSTSHLPDFFKRWEQSRSDFAWLAPRVPAAVAGGRLDARLGAAVLYHHGLALERSNDRSYASAAWREAIRLGPDTRAGADARKKLEGRP
jgi:hypothetical protein